MDDRNKRKCIEAEDTTPEPDWDAEPLQNGPTPYDFQFPDAEAFPEDGDGKNLLLNSQKYNSAVYWMSSYNATEDINADDYYTLTIWGNLAVGKDFFRVNVGAAHLPDAKKISDGVYQGSGKLVDAEKITETTDLRLLSPVAMYNSAGKAESQITRIKLEKGGTGTPWTPAPEDFEQMEPETREELLLDAWYKKQQVPIVPESRFEKFLSRIIAKPQANTPAEAGDGKNLVLNSDVPLSYDKNSGYHPHWNLSEDIELNVPYTFTIWGNIENETQIKIHLGSWATDWNSIGKFKKTAEGVYQVSGALTKWSGDGNYIHNILYVQVYASANQSQEIYKVKLEKGDTGTPWTPAPEDLINDDLVPKTRVEKLLDMIYTGDYLFFTPESRVEMFLNAIRKGVVINGLCPETREEMFLYRLMWQYSYEHKDYSDAISLRFDMYAMPKKVALKTGVIVDNISEAEYNDKFKFTAAGFYWARNKEELEAVENYVELAAKNESKQYKVSPNVIIYMSKYNNLAEVTEYYNSVTYSVVIPYYARAFFKYEVDGRKYIYFNTNGDNGIVEVQADDIWTGISRAVKDGVMVLDGNKGNKHALRIGDTVDTLDSTTGQTLTWRVVDFDNHKAADPELTHTMTLEMTTVYSDADGNRVLLQYNPKEALYYAENGLTAGIYNFTIDNSTWVPDENGKVYQFEITKDVPAGGQLFINNMVYNQTAEGKTISSYMSPDVTNAIETVTVTEGSEGISLGTTDGTGNINHFHRMTLGNNNYGQSGIRQWLNSDADASSVWVPQTKFSRPPEWANSLDGFMKGLPASFLGAVKQCNVLCHTNSMLEIESIDGADYTTNQVYSLQDKFFLLSQPEIFGTYDSEEYKDGILLEYYNGATNDKRIKNDVVGTAFYCLRSPLYKNTFACKIVREMGNEGERDAYLKEGIAPACIIA